MQVNFEDLGEVEEISEPGWESAEEAQHFEHALARLYCELGGSD